MFPSQLPIHCPGVFPDHQSSFWIAAGHILRPGFKEHGGSSTGAEGRPESRGHQAVLRGRFEVLAEEDGAENVDHHDFCANRTQRVWLIHNTTKGSTRATQFGDSTVHSNSLMSSVPHVMRVRGALREAVRGALDHFSLRRSQRGFLLLLRLLLSAQPGEGSFRSENCQPIRNWTVVVVAC